MGSPRITYNSSINIDLVMGRSGLKHIPKQNRNENESASGKIETINLFGRFDYEFEAYFTEQIYFDLWAWWSWARQGKAWAFALDSANVGNTTLDGAAAAGQPNIPLTSTAAFADDDFCLIRAADADDEFEIIKIASIDPNVSATAVDNLKFTYASGDIFTHKDYFSSVLTSETEFDPPLTGVLDKTLKYFTHIFKFTENL